MTFPYQLHNNAANRGIRALGGAKPMVSMKRIDAAHQLIQICRKVRIVLDELNLPYEWKVIEFSEVKCDSYLSINPNGRLPAIQDPNNDITLWEVGILEAACRAKADVPSSQERSSCTLLINTIQKARSPIPMAGRSILPSNGLCFKFLVSTEIFPSFFEQLITLLRPRPVPGPSNVVRKVSP